MRFFALLNFQQLMAAFFSALLFMLLFIVALGYIHFHSENDQQRLTLIHARYHEQIDGRNAPFPLAIVLIIGGTLIWGFFYILFYGIEQVRL
jgi:hypothetical protein